MKLSSTTVMVTSFLLFSMVAVAFTLKGTSSPEFVVSTSKEDVKEWEPSEEDIAFQDSMYAIIERTQLDLDTIRAGIDRILYKLDRFDYPDGTYDSIRYVVGGKIDKRLNKK